MNDKIVLKLLTPYACNGIEFTLLRIFSENHCKIKIKHHRTIKSVHLAPTYAVPVIDGLGACMGATNYLNEVDVYLNHIPEIKSFNEVAQKKINKYGLSNAQLILSKIVPVTVGDYNYRFKDWLFTVEKNILVDVHLIQCQDCLDTKKITVYDECFDFFEKGCPHCTDGLHKRVIPCQTCKTIYLTNVKKKVYNKNCTKHKSKLKPKPKIKHRRYA